MRILHTKPPCYEQAAALFKLKETDPVFFTYGDAIYNPAGVILTPDLLVHEETHGDQQEHHPDVANIWWQRYLHDPEFRVEQEAEAYGAQYRWICRQKKDRNARARCLHIFATALAGSLYGKVIAYNDAREKIYTYAENKFPDA